MLLIFNISIFSFSLLSLIVFLRKSTYTLSLCMTCNPMVPTFAFRLTWKYPRKYVTFVLSTCPLAISLVYPTKSRSTADLSWSVLTSSSWFGTGNIWNVFSRPSPETTFFPPCLCLLHYSVLFTDHETSNVQRPQSSEKKRGRLWPRYANRNPTTIPFGLWKRKCGAVGIEL